MGVLNFIDSLTKQGAVLLGSYIDLAGVTRLKEVLIDEDTQELLVKNSDSVDMIWTKIVDEEMATNPGGGSTYNYFTSRITRKYPDPISIFFIVNAGSAESIVAINAQIYPIDGMTEYLEMQKNVTIAPGKAINFKNEDITNSAGNSTVFLTPVGGTATFQAVIVGGISTIRMIIYSTKRGFLVT